MPDRCGCHFNAFGGCQRLARGGNVALRPGAGGDRLVTGRFAQGRVANGPSVGGGFLAELAGTPKRLANGTLDPAGNMGFFFRLDSDRAGLIAVTGARPFGWVRAAA